MKRCKDCGQELPATLAYFYAHPMTRDRLFRVCKACHCHATNEREKRQRAARRAARERAFNATA